MKSISKKKQTYSSEFEFFVTTPLTKYEGKYIALLGKKVVASGSTAKEVWKKARKKYPNKLPTIAKLPKKELLVMSWK